MNHSETKKLVVTTGIPSANVFAERVSLVNEAGQSISTKTDAELNSRYLPWQPNTAYTAGTFVSNAGLLYTVDANFTSPASFNTTGLTLAFVPRTATVAPGIIVPPASVVAAAIATSWYAANYAIFHRFELVQGRTVRYINYLQGTQSGNIQVGIVSLSGANRLTFTRVANSGVIAAPAGTELRIDIGATALPPGDYAVFFWSSNTTITIPNSSQAMVKAMRLTAEYTDPAGVPASGTFGSFSTRFLPGLVLEGDV